MSDVHTLAVDPPIAASKSVAPIGVGRFPMRDRPMPEATVEGFDVGVGGWLSRTAEVKRHPFCIGKQIAIAGDGLGALVDADCLRIADLRTYLFQRPGHVLDPVLRAERSMRSTTRNCLRRQALLIVM